MIPYAPLWTQWMFLAVLGGLVLLITFVLAWWPLWQSRRNVDEEGPARGWRATWRYMPWVLIVTYIGTLGASLVYGIAKAISPPNW